MISPDMMIGFVGGWIMATVYFKLRRKYYQVKNLTRF